MLPKSIRNILNKRSTKSLKYSNKTAIQNIAEWCIVMWQVFQGCLRCKRGLKDSFDTFLFNVNIRTATSLALNAQTSLVLYCRRVSMVNLQNEQFLSVQPFLFEIFHWRDIKTRITQILFQLNCDIDIFREKEKAGAFWWGFSPFLDDLHVVLIS